MTAVQLLRGFTSDDLRKVRAGIIFSLLNLIHSLVSMAHQGIHICTIIGLDGNPDAGADRNFVAIHDKGLSEAIQDCLRNVDCILHLVYIR